MWKTWDGSSHGHFYGSHKYDVRMTNNDWNDNITFNTQPPFIPGPFQTIKFPAQLGYYNILYKFYN